MHVCILMRACEIAICVLVYIHTFMSTITLAVTRANRNTCVHVCVYIYINIHMYKSTELYACVSLYVYANNYYY